MQDDLTLGEHLARQRVKDYDRIRTLENAVRKHTANDCECTSPHECLAALHKLIPVNPRPTLREKTRTKHR